MVIGATPKVTPPPPLPALRATLSREGRGDEQPLLKQGLLALVILTF